LGTHGGETPFRVRVLRRRLATHEHPKRSFQERVSKQSLGTRLSTLTQQEEAAGLLADPATIGTRTGWLSRLQEKGLTLRGHRLIKLSPAKAEMP
jgi:hypothetical protein